MQNYGLLSGAAGAVGTFLAPETVAPESAVEAGIAMYAFGSSLKDSISITKGILGFGNGSGRALSIANNMLLSSVPEGLARTSIEAVLDKAESTAGLDKGDDGGCP